MISIKHTEQLNGMLAEKVMGWNVCPDRFLTGKRSWIARWRFQPTKRIEDAFKLLDAAAPTNYSIGNDRAGEFWARVQIGEITGEAIERSKPAAITLAVARAVGIVVGGSPLCSSK